MTIQKRLVFIFLCVISLSIHALESQEINIEKGEGYETIDPPQPTDDPGKVEVIEFFWYGCPHCYRFEPILQKWLKTRPDYVNYIPQPTAFNATWAKHARAYYTAEALGVIDKMHEDFFTAIQIDKKRLDKEDVLADFFAAHGVKKEDFTNTYSSFLVEAKTRQAEAAPGRYGVTGVPAVVINGKYRVSGTTAKNYDNMIKVMDYLIAKEHAALTKTTVK
ncbi:MAG TPA: thiol:disulfide interchange protein DsbA/DsbL [Crenotrichaceae bacterium]|nr:thiol:disulfide interchange protein DsbA/DsbL [Crenotrichaceae bacterium]